MRKAILSLIFVLAFAAVGFSQAAVDESVAISPLGLINLELANTAEEKQGHWIGTWATAAQPAGRAAQKLTDQTFRLIVHVTAGGRRCRIKISNTFGTDALILGRVQVARRTSGANIDPAGSRTLAFAGKSQTTVPPGAMVISDPISIDIPALSDLAISIYLPKPTLLTTIHELAKQTSYISTVTGDHTSDERLPASNTIRKWPFLTGIEVESSSSSFSIVAFGSSLTDGDGTTADTNHRWPNVVAERLQQATQGDRAIGVLNEGIIGNRLLNDSPTEAVDGLFGRLLGESGLSRFQRDVIDQTSVRYVVVGLGINDIAFPGSITPADDTVIAANLIAGYRRLIRLAHNHRIKVIGTTNPPFEDSFLGLPPPKPPIVFFSPAKESVRQEVNGWILHSGEFDGVVDLDAVLRDSTHPSRLNPAFDSGDHLHPNDAGNVAEADAFFASDIWHLGP